MPIEWAHVPQNSSLTQGYADILRYVGRYRRLDAIFDLIPASFENGYINTEPEQREGYLDRQRSKPNYIKRGYPKQRKSAKRPRRSP